MSKNIFTRRQALAGLSSLAAAPLALAQQPRQSIGDLPDGIPPRTDLANVLEFENMAARKLAPCDYAAIAGSDRAFFERITFRPRMMVPMMNLDLSLQLFGDKMYAPIIAGPIAKLQTYHPDGEAGMARAASAAKAWMVVSENASMPLEKITAESSTILWYQVSLESDPAAVRDKINLAVKSGCKAICITTQAPFPSQQACSSFAKLAEVSRPPINWNVIDQIRKGVNVPILIKGIMTAGEAEMAVKRGIQGIIVSNYGGLLAPGMAPPMEMLPAIVDGVAGKAPVLIDGNFRRGSDIFKALAYGATAVLIGRPLVWGLAAYGPEGAQQVLEMLQTEVARDMAQSGKLTLKNIDRTVVKLHEA